MAVLWPQTGDEAPCQHVLSHSRTVLDPIYADVRCI